MALFRLDGDLIVVFSVLSHGLMMVSLGFVMFFSQIKFAAKLKRSFCKFATKCSRRHSRTVCCQCAFLANYQNQVGSTRHLANIP